MPLDRRRFLESAALSAGSLALACSPRAPGGTLAATSSADDSLKLPDAIRALTPMTNGIVPIGDDERKRRIEKAQRLMTENRMDAIFMEGATSCFCFIVTSGITIK